MLKHEALTNEIIRCYYDVYNELGFGFLEKVYENAYVIRLQEKGIHGKRQVPIKVFYHEHDVGLYYADIVVEDVIIIEMKAAENLCLEHELQLKNYLRATDKEIGFLFNFGIKPEFRRQYFENQYKRSVQTS